MRSGLVPCHRRNEDSESWQKQGREICQKLLVGRSSTPHVQSNGPSDSDSDVLEPAKINSDSSSDDERSTLGHPQAKVSKTYALEEQLETTTTVVHTVSLDILPACEFDANVNFNYNIICSFFCDLKLLMV